MSAIGGPAAELRQGERVKGAGGDGVVDTQRVESVDELAGGATGERDRQHVARLGEVLADAVCDAARQHPRLARSRRREDRQGRVRLRNGCALVRVEVREQRVVVRHASDGTGRVRRQVGRRAAGGPETREDPE